MSRQGRFQGKTVIVTGGALGIGEATSTAFAAEGARLVIADIDTVRGAALAERLCAAGGEAWFVATDVTSEDSVTALAAETMRRTGRIDVLVNNAGADPASCDGIRMSLADWHKVFDINVTSAWLATCAVLDAMIAQGGGAIVNLSSMLAIRHTPLQSIAYSASKAAVIRLTEVTAARYAAQNIRANVLAPGLTLTPAIESMLSPEVIAREAARVSALQRLATPAEQAAAILFLASDEASYLTGQLIRGDGGWSVM